MSSEYRESIYSQPQYPRTPTEEVAAWERHRTRQAALGESASGAASILPEYTVTAASSPLSQSSGWSTPVAGSPAVTSTEAPPNYFPPAQSHPIVGPAAQLVSRPVIQSAAQPVAQPVSGTVVQSVAKETTQGGVQPVVRTNEGTAVSNIDIYAKKAQAEAAARHKRSKRRRCTCCFLNIIGIALALIAILVPIIYVSRRKNPRNTTLYSALISCNPDTPYNTFMASQPQYHLDKTQLKSLEHQKIKDKSKLFTPYTGQCDHHLPSSSSFFIPQIKTPLNPLSIPGPFEIKVSPTFQLGTPYTQLALDNLDALAKRKSIDLRTYPSPPILNSYLIDEATQLGGELTCLTRSPQILDPGILYEDLLAPIEYNYMAPRSSADWWVEWEQKRREIEGYQRDAVEIWPGDGWDWEWNLDGKHHGGAEELKMKGWSCWLSKVYDKENWRVDQDGWGKLV